MVNQLIVKQVHAELERMTLERQRDVLEYARWLGSGLPRGTPGSELLKFAGLIPPEDLREMERAIEDGCERIVPNKWSGPP